MYYVYILQSEKDLRTYVGYTTDFGRRFTEHNLGRVVSTKHRRPFVALHVEEFWEAKEAKKRELWWKGSTGRKKMRAFFERKPLERGSPRP